MADVEDQERMELSPVKVTTPSASSSSSPSPSTFSTSSKSSSKYKSSDASSDASSAYRFNIAFLRHSLYALRVGLGRPWEEPVLWCVLIFNLLCQALTPYNVQSYFYIVATGRDANYPGIGGCLKSGCGGAASPGDFNMIHGYMVQFAWMFLITLFGVGCMAVSGDIINTRMRARLTTRFQKRLLTDKLWYRLSLDNALDNIDQRISSDLQQFLDGITVCLFGNTADYQIYPIGFTFARMTIAFSLAVSPLGSSVQLQILWSLLAMAAVAMIAYIFPMNHISRLFGKGQQYEGDFRTSHSRALLHCESICTLNGEEAEHQHAQAQFQRLADNKEQYYWVQGGLMFLKLLATITQPNIGYMMLAVAGTTDSTTANFFIKQLGDVLEYLLYFPAIIARLAFAAGAGHRVGELVDRMTAMERAPLSSSVVISEELIELSHVTANPPAQHQLRAKSSGPCCSAEEEVEDDAIKLNTSNRALFQDVTLRVEKGNSVVIMGPSGCGKSSLLRIIGGLWGIDSGTVTIPSLSNMFFLPQRPYVFPSTLLQLITYPDQPNDKGDEDSVRSILKVTMLSHLADKYGMQSSENWPTLLSISEQQRINFARLFYRRPAFCLSDESSSAMDLRTEAILLEHATVTLGITMISVAHRPSVIHHHKNVFLYDKPSRSWSLVPASSVARPEDKYVVDKSETTEDKAASPHSAAVQEELSLSEDENAAGGITLLFWKRLWGMISLAVPSFFCLETLMFLTTLFCMGVNGGVIIVVFLYYPTSGIINDVIAGRNSNAFNTAGIYLGINVVSAIVQSISSVLGAQLTLRIQAAVVKKFHYMYFQPQVPYQMNRVVKFKGIDQRMVQDLSALREYLSWLFGSPFSFQQYRSGLLPQLVTFIMLIGYAFSIAWSLTVLFCIVLVISIIWQALSSVITSKYTQQRQAREGTLRLHYARVLNNIESITFFRGQDSELLTAETMSTSLETSTMTLMLYLALTTFPSVAIYYWLQTGEYEMSAMMQVYWSWAQLNVANLLTILPFCVLCGKAVMEIVKALGGLGGLAGLTHRVAEVLEATEYQLSILQARETPSTDPQHQGRRGSIHHDNTQISAQHLAVRTPSRGEQEGRPLLQNVDFKINKGETLLIMGPSGCGKSGILRCLSGLWQPASGTVRRPQHIGFQGIMFGPQTSYCPAGSLCAQLLYPMSADESDDDPDSSQYADVERDVASCLRRVGLDEVVDKWGLHRVANWELVLSGGEQQRLAMARVLYQQPDFVVMDESTSALDHNTESKVMNEMLSRRLGILSVGSRPALKHYHQRIVTFKSDGSQVLQDNQGSSSSSSSQSVQAEAKSDE